MERGDDLARIECCGRPDCAWLTDEIEDARAALASHCSRSRSAAGYRIAARPRRAPQDRRELCRRKPATASRWALAEAEVFAFPADRVLEERHSDIWRNQTHSSVGARLRVLCMYLHGRAWGGGLLLFHRRAIRSGVFRLDHLPHLPQTSSKPRCLNPRGSPTAPVCSRRSTDTHTRNDSPDIHVHLLKVYDPPPDRGWSGGSW